MFFTCVGHTFGVSDTWVSCLPGLLSLGCQFVWVLRFQNALNCPEAATMNPSMPSKAGGGAELCSPPQTITSTGSANNARQTPSTDASFRPGQPGGFTAVAANRTSESGPDKIINVRTKASPQVLTAV